TTVLPGMDLTEVGLETAGACADVLVAGPLRLRRPDRNQSLMQTCWLDEVLPADHQARTVWAVVEKLDWTTFQESLKARVRSQVLCSALAYDLLPFAQVWITGVRENNRIPDGVTEKGSAGRGETGTGLRANDHPLSP
ncbi:MAG: hypothetical protein AAB363_11275, partial [Planctomycetota bacterium]